MFTLRSLQLPDDIRVLAGLDTSFTTERIYRVVREDLAFLLREEAVTPPLRKQYDCDPADPIERQNWEHAVIAEAEGQLAGFAAAKYEAWNRRIVLWALYVMPAHRGQGAGTQLLDAVETYARSVQARGIWLETQNINYPAIQFYRRCGFQFCGFDASLYDPKILEQEEVALFFFRPVTAPE